MNGRELAAIGAGLVIAALYARAQSDELTPPAEIPPEELPPPLYSPDPPLMDPAQPNPLGPPFAGGHNEFDNQVLYVCTLYAMTDPLAVLFMKATIQEESNWQPGVAGDCGYSIGPYRGRGAGCLSIGLMQVNRQAHPDLAAAYDLWEPNANMLAGGQVLAGAYRAFHPNWPRIRATYQGGAGAGASYPNVDPRIIRSVDRVMGSFRIYAQASGVSVV